MMMKTNHSFPSIDEPSGADWLRADHGYTRRAARTPGLPFLGLLVGGLVSVLLWTGLSVSLWALLER